MNYYPKTARDFLRNLKEKKGLEKLEKKGFKEGFKKELKPGLKKLEKKGLEKKEKIEQASRYA